jgi:hypothetical protein
MSNLRLINETLVTSAVSAVNITDVFSSDFDIYKVTCQNFSNSTGAQNTELRFINSSGSVITSSQYDWAYLRLNDYGSFTEARNTTDDHWENFWGKDDSASGETQNVVNYIFNPFLSSAFTYGLTQSSNALNSQLQGIKGIGVLKQLSSITGFQILFNANASNNGKIRTYGLRVNS